MSFKNLFKVVGKYTEFRYRGYSYPKASINCSFRSCANYADQESCLQDEKKISVVEILTYVIVNAIRYFCSHLETCSLNTENFKMDQSLSACDYKLQSRRVRIYSM